MLLRFRFICTYHCGGIAIGLWMALLSVRIVWDRLRSLVLESAKKVVGGQGKRMRRRANRIWSKAEDRGWSELLELQPSPPRFCRDGKRPPSSSQTRQPSQRETAPKLRSLWSCRWPNFCHYRDAAVVATRRQDGDREPPGQDGEFRPRPLMSLG